MLPRTGDDRGLSVFHKGLAGSTGSVLERSSVAPTLASWHGTVRAPDTPAAPITRAVRAIAIYRVGR
jgi:hypothetical protein